MKKLHVVLAAAVVAGLAGAAAGQSPFTPGNIVVLRVGDGAASLSNAATPVFLQEISPMGIEVQTIAMPTVAAIAGNRAATISGTATSEGALSLSVDGRFLTYGGYNADAGTATVAGTTSAAVNRVVARIASDGTVDTTTAFSDSSYSGSNIRSAITTDGTDIWTGGNASSGNGGVRYSTFGGESSILVSDTPSNTRVVGIFGGQLYVTTQSGAYRGVNMVGVGLPTEPGQITTLLPGFDPATNSPQNNYGFYFADADTLYLADERTLASGGGVQKWTFDGFNWTLAYTMQNGLTNGVRGIAGTTDGSGTTLYVVTSDSISGFSGNKLMRAIDAGPATDFVLIATAPGNTAYRGVAFAPEGSGVSVCYANCDLSTAEPILNVDDFTCFINAFAAAQSLPHAQQVLHYANCDASTLVPALNVDDFTCFINAFAQGCR